MNELQIANTIDIIAIVALSIFIANQIIDIIANYRYFFARKKRLDELQEKYTKLRESVENDMKKRNEAIEEIKRLKKLLKVSEN